MICGSSDLHCHYTLFSNSLFSPLSTHSLKLILATFHISSGSKLLTYLVFNVAEKDSSFCLCTRLSSTVHCYLHYKSPITSEPKFTSSQNYQNRLLHYGSERLVTPASSALALSSTTPSLKTSENFIFNILNLNNNSTNTYPRFQTSPETHTTHLLINTM